MLHYKRRMFIVEQTPETLALRKRRCRVYESADGSIYWRCGDIPLRFRVHEKVAHVDQGEIVTNKRLGRALAHIQQSQKDRDRRLLRRKDITTRDKERMRHVAAL